MIHCWEGKNNEETEESFTCMLQYGHKGKHEFVNDKGITVQFNTVRSTKSNTKG